MSTSDRQHAEDALVTLRARVDDHFTRTHARHAASMHCHLGCDRCCHVRLTVFGIEAERIAAALRALESDDPELRARIRRQADDPTHADRCALLVDGRCATYQERPLICRSHGVPVLAPSDDGDAAVSCCPLNFEDGAFPRDALLHVEAVNRPLSVMATLWDGEGTRVSLTALARGEAPGG